MWTDSQILGDYLLNIGVICKIIRQYGNANFTHVVLTTKLKLLFLIHNIKIKQNVSSKLNIKILFYFVALCIHNYLSIFKCIIYMDNWFMP